MLRYLLVLVMLWAWSPAIAGYTQTQYDNFYLVRQQVSGDMFYTASAVMMRETLAGEYPFLVDQIHKNRPIRFQSFGLMQVKVGTARHMMAVYNYGSLNWSDQYIATRLLNDKEFNIKTGVLYLQWLKSIGLSKEEMITAYNIGPGRYHIISRPARFSYTKFVLEHERRLKNDPVIWKEDFRHTNGDAKHLKYVISRCNRYGTAWDVCDFFFLSMVQRMYAARTSDSLSLELKVREISSPNFAIEQEATNAVVALPMLAAIMTRKQRSKKTETKNKLFASATATWFIAAWITCLWVSINLSAEYGLHLFALLFIMLLVISWKWVYRKVFEALEARTNQ